MQSARRAAPLGRVEGVQTTVIECDREGWLQSRQPAALLRPSQRRSMPEAISGRFHRKCKYVVRAITDIGGRGGIRTHGGLAPTAVFKTAALNHSATLPRPSPVRVFDYRFARDETSATDAGACPCPKGSSMFRGHARYMAPSWPFPNMGDAKSGDRIYSAATLPAFAGQGGACCEWSQRVCARFEPRHRDTRICRPQ